VNGYKRNMVLVLIAVAAVVILAFDLLLPLGVAGAVPYVALVLLGMWLPSRRYILALAGLGTVLTVVGYVLSPVGGISWVVLTNRGLALFAIWITAFLLMQHKKREEEIRVLNADLTVTNEQLEKEATERKRAEEELKAHAKSLEQRTSELDAANRELEAFAYSVSHDLRGPLRGMDGFSLALLEDYGDKFDAEGKDYLQRVRAGSQKMAQLIDDLLKLSRVSRADLVRREVNLSEVAQAVAADLQENAAERPVTFDIAPGAVVGGDARLLRIVLENLFGNAWKFTAKHDQATIEFGVTNHDGKPAYFVRDDGVGFDMAYADKLFQPFQRLHSGAEFGGTGIGLATVARIVHRHGGSVWAESVIDQGTTFYFTL